MKGYIYCKECGKKIALLDEVEFAQLKAEGDLPVYCDPCLYKKICSNEDLNLGLDFLGDIEF